MALPLTRGHRYLQTAVRVRRLGQGGSIESPARARRTLRSLARMQNAGLAILAAGLILSSGNAFAAVGDITQYPVPTPGSVPDGIAAGPDGNIWFTELGANKVAKVTTSGGFTEYPVPTPNSGPSRITAGPDGNLWFTEVQAGKVGKVTTSGVF